MKKSVHDFVDMTDLSFRVPRLLGYPVKVPGHLLVADVIARPEKNDVDTVVRVFGTGGVRSVLQGLVEKGRINSAARDAVQLMLIRYESDPSLYRTI